MSFSSGPEQAGTLSLAARARPAARACPAAGAHLTPGPSRGSPVHGLQPGLSAENPWAQDDPDQLSVTEEPVGSFN